VNRQAFTVLIGAALLSTPPIHAHAQPVLSSVTAQPHDGSTAIKAEVVLTGAAPTGGIVVTLSSSSNRASVPQFVTVPVGANKAPFTITANAAPQPAMATILATGQGVSKTVDITIIPPFPIAVAFTDNGTSPFSAPRVIRSNEPALVRVTLSAPPPGPYIAQLTSNHPAFPATQLSFQNSQIPTGDVQITLGGVSKSTDVTVTATIGGKSTSAILTITPPQLNSVVVQPATVVGGQATQGVVSLRSEAPAGGLPVRLASSMPSDVMVPASVTVPAGTRQATFTIGSLRRESIVSATITASTDVDQRTDRLTVGPEGPTSLTMLPSEVTGGASATGKVDALLSADAFVVDLSSDKPSAAQISGQLLFQPGNTSKTFGVSTTPVTQDVQVTITATTTSRASPNTTAPKSPGNMGVTFTVSRTATLMVRAPIVSGFTIGTTTMVESTQGTGTLTLNVPAPPGGMPISVSYQRVASQPTPLTTVTVPAGATSASFQFTAPSVSGDTSLDFIATSGRLPKVVRVLVRDG
jgi:trimeric autotransporter adhesin